MEEDQEKGSNDKPEIGLEVHNEILRTQSLEESEEERIQENGIEEQENKTEDTKEQVENKLVFSKTFLILIFSIVNVKVLH